MRTYSRYDASTGLLTGHYFSCNLENADRALAFAQGNAGDGHGVIQGQHDHLCKRVDLVTLNVLDYIPDAPDSDHEWDATVKRWVLKPDVVARQQRVADARAAIQQLESTQPRLLRNMALGKDGAREALEQLDRDIATQQSIVDGAQ